MAPVKKKPRCVIGAMSDTVVQETQLQSNNSSESEDESDNTKSPSHEDSGDSDATKSPSNDSDEDRLRNGDNHVNDQAIIPRGPAKMGFQWGTGKVMLLKLDPDNNVVGDNAVAFSSQLGILAKDGNKLPLSYTDWRALPDDDKNLVLNEVKENTNLTNNYKKNCLKKLGKLWRDWKSRLKAKYYKPHKGDKSVALANCPKRVEPAQWPVLVNYWSTRTAKKLSKSNKNSRNHVKLPPRLGRKDMAGAKDEYRQEHGKEPSKLDLFLYTRQKKSEKPVDDNTVDKVAHLKELKQKLPEELIDDIETNDDIFEKVIGDEAPRYFRSNHGGSSKNNDLVYVSREEFDQAVEERCKGKITSMQKEMDAKLSKEMEAKFQQFQDEYWSRMSVLQSRVLMSEDQNPIVSGSFNSRRVQAPNKGSLSQEELMNLELCRGDIRGMRNEIDDHDENNTGIHFDGVHLQEERDTARINKKKKTKHP